MNDLMTFDFQQHAVRVLMIDDAPWWVATDLCAILDLKNVTNAIKRLDDDEKGLNQIKTLGGVQELNIVSESGMWTLVLRSDKPEAAELRRWLTREVLPSIRRTGSYAFPGAAGPELTTEHLRVSNALLRTAQSLFGAAGARELWPQIGLPPLNPPDGQRDDLDRLIALWVEGRDRFTYDELAEGIGLGFADNLMKRRMADVLHYMGWEYKKARRGATMVRAWRRTTAVIIQGGRHD